MKLVTPQCCNACGQPLLPTTGLGLSPLQWRIYNTVREQPDIKTADLLEWVWPERVEGPEYPASFHTLMWKTNQRLHAHGLVIRATRSGRSATWRIYHLARAEAAG